MGNNVMHITVDLDEFNDVLRTMDRMHDAIDPDWLKSTMRRRLEPMAESMRENSKSTRIADMISITVARKRTGKYGAKVGVVKNNEEKFPDISAQALAALLEYGSEGERFRQSASYLGGAITVQQSTGVMPADPFLRPAYDKHIQSFINKTQESIERKVQKAAGLRRAA